MNSIGKTLLLVGIVAFSNTNAQQPICIGKANGITIADPQVPNQYYICENYIPIPMTCPASLVFCKTNLLGTCQQSCPSLNPVTASPAAPTPAPISWYPTAPTPAETPAENPWFPTAPTPAPTPAPIENIPTAPTAAPLVNPDECVNQANDIIFPVPGSCTGYATCVNGKPIVAYCLGNRAFDAATGTCSETLC